MTDPLETFFWENRRLFREAAAVADKALQHLKIDASARALLEFLARETDSISLSELARKRSVSRQHIHQSLARLNPKWVQKLPDPSDARSVRLTLTREGRVFWNKIRAADRSLLRRLTQHVNASELQRATAFIRHIRKLLQEKP